jgi:anti-sigma factor RsiW
MTERTDDRCPGFEEDLSAWMDGELPPPRAAQLVAHVASCGACADRVAALRAVDAGLQSLDAGTDPARIARIHEAIAARIHGDVVVALPAARRAPPRTRRWAAPLLAGAIGAAAAATLVLLVRPTPAPETIAREHLAAARELAPPPAAPPAELLARTTQSGVEAFAKKGAAAVDEGATGAQPPSRLELDSARDLEMIERISSLSEAERRKLDRNLARWEAMSPEEREKQRAQWRPAAEPAVVPTR